MILGVLMLGLYFIGRWDKPLGLRREHCPGILTAAALELFCVLILTGDGSVTQGFLWAALGGSLLLACVTDCLLSQVYNFTWWLALAAAAPLLWQYLVKCTSGGSRSVRALLAFGLLQFGFFRRTYGRADCYAFCVCAVAEAALGLRMAGFLKHMLSAYGLLLAVQLSRRNLDGRGNLKKPVPFLPYITISFWITVLSGG